MTSRGFEFAYMLDGSNATPLIRDWPMVADASGYEQGDLVTVDSAGRADKVTTGVGMVLGVVMEREPDAVSNDDLLKIAILTRNQVWRCSTDAATATTAIPGYIRKWDTVDENTIDASDINSGSMIVVDKGVDDDGNVLGYVCFADTAFGNAA